RAPLRLWAARGCAALVVQSCFRTRGVHPESAGGRYAAPAEFLPTARFRGPRDSTHVFIHADNEPLELSFVRGVTFAKKLGERGRVRRAIGRPGATAGGYGGEWWP